MIDKDEEESPHKTPSKAFMAPYKVVMALAANRIKDTDDSAGCIPGSARPLWTREGFFGSFFKF